MGRSVKLGNVVRIPFAVTDGAGPAPAYIDPASVTITIRNPAGTTVASGVWPAGTIVRDDEGRFHLDVPTGAGGTITTTGTYFVEAVSTGTVVDESDWFDLIPAGLPGLLTLADAKNALGKTRTVDDVELQLFVDAVNTWLDKEIGPVVPRTVTETVYASRGVLILSWPVLSISSATRYGASVSTAGWTEQRGIVRAPYAALAGDYAVTYLAGYSPVPADLQLALRELVQHWWATQRAASPAVGAAGSGEVGGYDPTLGFAVPNRVAEKIEHYRPAAIA